MSVIKYVIGSAWLRNASFFLTIATGLIVTPVLVRTLGNAEYAKWILVNTLLIYFMVFDFGYSTSVARFVSSQRKTWGEDSVQKCIASAFYVLLAAGVGAMLLVVAGYGYIKDKYMSGMPDDVILSVMFLVVSFACMVPLKTFHGVLRSQLKWNTISLIVMLRSVAMNGVIILLVLNGYGLVGVIVPNAVFVILEYLAYYVFARRALSFSLNPKLVEYRIVKALSSFSLYLFLHQVALMFSGRVQNYFIALYISLPAVTVYTIGLQLLKYFDDMMRSSFDVMTPYFSRHEDNPEKMIQDYIHVASYCFGAAAFGGFMLFAYCESFLYFWVGPELVESSLVVFALVIPYVLYSAHIPSRSLLISTSNHQFLVGLSVVEFSINLAALFYVVPRFGMTGILWTMGSTMLLFRGVIFPIMFMKIMQISMWRFLRSVYLKPFVTFVVPQLAVYFTIFQLVDRFSLEVSWVFVLNLFIFFTTFYFIARKGLERSSEQTREGA